MMLKRMFLAINIFLSIILIAVALSTRRSLRQVDIEGLPEAIGDYGLSLPQPVTKPLSHYLVIDQRRLFGSFPSPDIDEEIPEPLEALPRTDLRLRLKGTVYGSPSFSRAIIEDLSSKKESLYRLGDLVAGAKIVRIERNQVVIEREGGREVLTMAYEEGQLARREDPGEAPLLSRPWTPEPPAASPIQIEREEMAVASEAAQRIVRELRLDPDALPSVPSNLLEAIKVANRVITRARIKPHFVERRLEGFRLVAIQPGSIYERLGLRPGDIIREVNGQRIDSIRDAFRIYQELQQQPAMTVNIERDGQPLSLVFEMR